MKASLKSVEKNREFTATYDGPVYGKDSVAVLQPQMHMELSTPSTDVSPNAYADIQNGRGILYAYGDITYDDIYGKSHETQFCVMYSAGMSAPIACETYNTAN